MQHIDYSFLPQEPETWFRLLFNHDHLSLDYLDVLDSSNINLYTEQILFQYKEPWIIQIGWSDNISEVLNGISLIESREPIILEWTNILANHWACHWLRKNQSPLAPGGLPIKINNFKTVENKWFLNIAITNKTTNKKGFIAIKWIAPEINVVTENRNTWSIDTLNFMDMLPLGSLVLNQRGEVTYINQWLRNNESYLLQKKLPLPWELVFPEGLLHDIWSVYHTYKRASYCTPWLHQIENQTGFLNGPYIVSLLPSHIGATLQLAPIPQMQIDALQKTRLDPLTKLFTRETWVEKLHHNNVKDSWILLLGIDAFSSINDGLGHYAGDTYLIEIASRLKKQYPSAHLGRWSGDEFILSFNQSQYPDIREIFIEPFKINDEILHGSGCVSVIKYNASIKFNDQVQQLEWTLRDAKTSGRGKLLVNKQEQKNIKEVRKQLFYIENRLRQAVALKQFFLLYQPLIRLSDKKIVGAEALIRWQHPELGVVSPQQFIPLAEQNGTIASMTSWVLNSAFEFTRDWASGFQFILSVNLSPAHFDDPAIVQDIQNLLSNSNFPPQNLKLEITEGAMLETNDSNKSVLQKLRDIGITFAIDDFGTGNASLSYLKEFPIHQLKIDKSYIHALHKPQHYLLTQSIIELAHRMNLVVVAEGVETQEQEDALLKMNCDLAQGFKYGKPMSAENLAHLLIEQEKL